MFTAAIILSISAITIPFAIAYQVVIGNVSLTPYNISVLLIANCLYGMTWLVVVGVVGVVGLFL